MTLTPRQIKAAKLLAERRKKKPNLLDDAFDKQRAFLDDPHRLKAALCTRRAGKSYGVGLLAVHTALHHPGVKVVIIGKTNSSIKDIYFKDVMNTIAKKFSIPWRLNRTEMAYYLENESEIKFIGADADQDQMNKLLGQKFKLAILDEASMYANIDLEELVYGVLRPALADHNGQMIMIGTPSNYLNSLYFKVTTGQEPAWSVHKWTANDNPHMAAQIADEELFIDQTNPAYRETTRYKQHNLGMWVVDLSSRVYKFDAKANSRPHDTNGYQHVIGVDLGYEDDTSFVVGAWSHYDTTMHIVHAEAKKHMDLDAVEKRIKELQARFNTPVTVIDGASKQFVETLQSRFRMAFTKTAKLQKKDFIELMNTDFLMGRINVLPGACAPLVAEWDNLIWDEKKLDRDPANGHVRGEWKEAKNFSNHSADAALYMWRWCYNYAAIPKVKPPTEEEVMEQKHQARIESNDNDHLSFFDSDLT